jgi:hypothetical protein
LDLLGHALRELVDPFVAPLREAQSIQPLRNR